MVSGKLAFFPWLTLPSPVLVGGFRFMPVDTRNPAPEIGNEIADTAKQVFSRYLDFHGKPISSCTVALRQRHPKKWDIPEKLWPSLFRASECLALIAMAEQRFFEQLSPHINGTLFRPVVQGVAVGNDGVSLFVHRRDGGLRAGGFRFKDLTFQMPLEAYGTECPLPSKRFAKALNSARVGKTRTWSAIEDALPFFLLGHSETTAMPTETNVMLSALAFERLLNLPKNKLNNANDVSKAFEALWAGLSTRSVNNAKRVVADGHSIQGPQQATWPIFRKWMKELYEARSEQAHGGKNSSRSSNWKPWQHLVIAAFTFPLSVKLRLASEGNYYLDVREIAACEALDLLLDSNWGSGWKKPPDWPNVLSMQESAKEWAQIVEDVLREVSDGNEEDPTDPQPT